MKLTKAQLKYLIREELENFLDVNQRQQVSTRQALSLEQIVQEELEHSLGANQRQQASTRQALSLEQIVQKEYDVLLREQTDKPKVKKADGGTTETETVTPVATEKPEKPAQTDSTTTLKPVSTTEVTPREPTTLGVQQTEIVEPPVIPADKFAEYTGGLTPRGGEAHKFIISNMMATHPDKYEGYDPSDLQVVYDKKGNATVQVGEWVQIARSGTPQQKAPSMDYDKYLRQIQQNIVGFTGDIPTHKNLTDMMAQLKAIAMNPATGIPSQEYKDLKQKFDVDKGKYYKAKKAYAARGEVMPSERPSVTPKTELYKGGETGAGYSDFAQNLIDVMTGKVTGSRQKALKAFKRYFPKEGRRATAHYKEGTENLRSKSSAGAEEDWRNKGIRSQSPALN